MGHGGFFFPELDNVRERVKFDRGIHPSGGQQQRVLYGLYICVSMETTNIAPDQSAQGFTHSSISSSPKNLPTVSWKAVAMPRAGDYDNISSSPQVNTGTKRMAKTSDRLLTVLQGGESSVGCP